MVKVTLKIDGMACSMCEAHINDAIRAAFPVKKVSSSHTKGETVMLLENAPSEEEIRTVIDKTGYVFGGMTCEPYEKKPGFFASLFGKK